MKKTGVLLIFIFLFLFITSIISANLSFVKADNGNNNDNTPPGVPGISEEDKQKIEDVVENIPLDEQGKLDEGKLDITKSKAEERIEKINQWLEFTDPVFDFTFGIKLRLSWEFAYLLFLVLISLSVFHNLPGWIGLNKEWFAILFGFGVTFALGFFRILKWLVEKIMLITNKWWWKLVAILILLIVLFILAGGGQMLKKWADKRREKADREKLHKGAEEAKHIGKVSRALNEGITK
jgi:hypothetical protein